MDSVSTYSRTQSHIRWIDVLRGIAILLVLVAHRNTLPGLRAYINSFHIPLFFVLSGYLFNPIKHTALVPFLQNRALRLLLPYMFFSLIAVPYEFLEAKIQNITIDFIWVIDIFTRLFALNGKTINNPPVWFLLSLFTVEIAFFFIAKFRSKSEISIILILLGVCGYMCSSWLCPSPMNLIWKINLSLILLPFFGLGNILRSSQLPRFGSILFFLLLAISLGGGYLYPILTGHKVLYYLQLNPLDSILFYLVALASILVFFSTAERIKQSPKLEWLGQNTIFLFGTHFMFYRALEGFSKLIGLQLPEAISGICVIVATIIISIPCIFFVNRFTPWIVGLKANNKP